MMLLCWIAVSHEKRLQYGFLRATGLGEIGKSWTELPGTRQRAILTALIERIDVGADQIDIHFRPARLSALLDVAAPLPSASDAETQILSVPLRLRRAGRVITMRIDGTDPFATAKPDARLINLPCRGDGPDRRSGQAAPARRNLERELAAAPARESTLAFLRGILEEVRFALDSPLEGTGFELPVRGRGQSDCHPFVARIPGGYSCRRFVKGRARANPL
jgi:hypothetical protein